MRTTNSKRPASKTSSRRAGEEPGYDPIPLAPMLLWLAGLAIFGLAALWTALRGLYALRRGLDAADRVLAPPTIAEEIEEARR